jgi:hypothetical protein
MPRTTFIRLYDDAAETIERVAAPGLEPAAEAIAEGIPANVPVDDGVMRASYRTAISPGTSPDGSPILRVHVGSPFWHWMEYGTAYNSAYRPVQRTVEGLGLRYEPR